MASWICRQSNADAVPPCSKTSISGSSFVDLNCRETGVLPDRQRQPLQSGTRRDFSTVPGKWRSDP